MKPRASEYEQGLGHDGIMLEASLYYWLLLSAALVLAASVSRAEDDPHRVYRVGFVAAQSPSTVPNGVSAFRDRLRELGYVQGQNLVIEARWAGELKVIAPARGLKLRVIDVREPAALDRAFAEAARTAQGVLVLPDPIMAAYRERIAVLAAKHRPPAMYYLRDFVDAGGLMAYGPELSVMSRRAGDYIDKILKGARPSDLPIEQPKEYVLIVNLKAADKLRLKIPESVLLRAGEVTR